MEGASLFEDPWECTPTLPEPWRILFVHVRSIDRARGSRMVLKAPFASPDFGHSALVTCYVDQAAFAGGPLKGCFCMGGALRGLNVSQGPWMGIVLSLSPLGLKFTGDSTGGSAMEIQWKLCPEDTFFGQFHTAISNLL